MFQNQEGESLMPKYSLIIPVYNVEDYIIECAISIHEQSYHDFEAIFVDDGSLDNSIKILQKYIKDNNDNRLHILSKKNGGLADARNYGLKKAHGEYIIFIDSDDFVSCDMLEQVDKVISDDNPDMLVFDFYIYYNEEKMKYAKALADTKGDSLIKKHLVSPPSAVNKVYKKGLFTANKIEFPKSLWYEDLATTTRLLPLTKKISYLNKPLYYYRQRVGSIMNTASNKLFDMYKVLDIIYKFYQDNRLYDEYKDEIERLFIYNCFFLVNAFGIAKYKESRVEQLKAIDYLEKHFPDWPHNIYLKKEKIVKKNHILIMKHRRLLVLYNLLRRFV